jgi:hypothetical protein
MVNLAQACHSLGVSPEQHLANSIQNVSSSMSKAIANSLGGKSTNPCSPHAQCQFDIIDH